MRSVVIGGGHLAYFAIMALREMDPSGKIVVIEFTSEKVDMLKKTFPSTEAVLSSIEGVEDYISKSRFLIDVLVVATDSDALNLRYAKHSIKNDVPIVIAILNNPLNEPIFARENVRYVINPYKTITSKIKEIVGKFDVNVVYEFSKIDGGIYAIKVENAKTLKRVRGFILKNDSPFFVLSADKRIRAGSLEDIQIGDVVYVPCHSREIKSFLRKMGG